MLHHTLVKRHARHVFKMLLLAALILGTCQSSTSSTTRCGSGASVDRWQGGQVFQPRVIADPELPHGSSCTRERTRKVAKEYTHLERYPISVLYPAVIFGVLFHSTGKLCRNKTFYRMSNWKWKINFLNTKSRKNPKIQTLYSETTSHFSEQGSERRTIIWSCQRVNASKWILLLCRKCFYF